jgi:hypothetical protein
MHRPRTPRAAAAALIVAAALIPLSAGSRHAAAQEPVVSLTLVRQTPWITPRDAGFEVEVRVRNDGEEPLEELSLAIIVSEATRSRSAYDLSLTSDPTLPIATVAVPLRGELAPGQTRIFEAELDLAEATRFAGQPLVYPVRVELRAADEAVGVLRTPVVFIFERPKEPLRLAWWWTLHHEVTFAPDGRFLSTTLERSIAPGGALNGAISGLAEVARADPPRAVTVVVSPILLQQLERMRSGYRIVVEGEEQEVPAGLGGAAVAGRTLDELRTIAGSEATELVALPYAVPVLPSLPASRLRADLPAQLDLGTAEVQDVLGTAPAAATARPTASAVDDDVLAALTDRGVTTLLLEAGDLPQPQLGELGFAPHPTASLVGPEGVEATAVLPDPGVQARIASEVAGTDPVLGAHIVLGELASIWLERPSLRRGIGLSIGADPTLPGPFLDALARLVGAAPFLRPVPAEALAHAFAPVDPPTAVPRTAGSAFTRDYVTDLKEARRLVGTMRSMLAQDSTVPDELRSLLLLSEAGEFLGLGELEGRTFIDHVRERTGEVLGAVRPVSDQVVTLTSRTGDIPVQITNASDRQLHVLVELVSPRLRFPGGATQEVTIGAEDVTLTYSVRTQATGRFPVRVLVKAPNGRIVGQDDLTVRSTAYSRVALSIVIGAGLVLIALWARRFVPRKS